MISRFGTMASIGFVRVIKNNGKIWNLASLFARPGISWNFDQGHGK